MLFTPHPEIPNHYTINHQFLLRTDDIENFGFNWSRVIHDNLIQDQGYLSFHGNHRVFFYGFYHDTDSQLQHINTDYIQEELSKICVPNTLLIIHYFPDGGVKCIITGINPSIFKAMNPDYKIYYHDFT